MEEIINRGGSIASNSLITSGNNKRKAILIKLDSATIDQIEAVARARKVKTTRQTWIEEAVIEKLARSNKN